VDSSVSEMDHMALLKTVMNLWAPQSMGNLLSICGIIGYSGKSDLVMLNGSLIVMARRVLRVRTEESWLPHVDER
jgi:hypothetical protein